MKQTHYRRPLPNDAIAFSSPDGRRLFGEASAEGGMDGTEPDTSWTNTHKHTYPFPSYPSAHGTVCAAAMTVLAATFGDQHHFTMHTPEVNASGPASPMIKMNPAVRSFDSFSAAAMECAISRVYLGIHFRYDAIEGNHLGQRVGGYVLDRFLKPREGR